MAGWPGVLGPPVGHDIGVRPGAATSTVGEYRSLLCLAGLLAANRASFVLVGSPALRLQGEPLPVHDIDAVIDPAPNSLLNLHSALSEIALTPERLPSAKTLGAPRIFRTVNPTGSDGGSGYWFPSGSERATWPGPVIPPEPFAAL